MIADNHKLVLNFDSRGKLVWAGYTNAPDHAPEPPSTGVQVILDSGDPIGSSLPMAYYDFKSRSVKLHGQISVTLSATSAQLGDVVTLSINTPADFDESVVLIDASLQCEDGTLMPHTSQDTVSIPASKTVTYPITMSHVGTYHIVAGTIGHGAFTYSVTVTDSLDNIKRAKITELVQASSDAINSTFSSGGHVYAFDVPDQANFIQQLVLMSIDPTVTEVQWTTKDSGPIKLTRDEFIQVAKDSASHKLYYEGECQKLEMQVTACQTPADVAAIKFTVNSAI